MKKGVVIILICALICMMAAFRWPVSHTDPCTRSQAPFRMPFDSLPEASNGWFASSGKCDHCHGFDPAGVASVDLEGGDVNVVDDWSSTMMANSGRDPFWRAKVSHEITVHPQYQQAIEDKCTSCHAPLGHFAAMFNGAANYSMAELIADDSVAIDGVSCLACHQQDSLFLGSTHSGNLHFVSNPVSFGPFAGPLVTPMALYSGYTPEFSTHISDAGICAGCHTLITETVDTDGNLTEDTFVEQATYHEWLNSVYETQETSCQDCHMPSLADQPVKLAAGYDTPPRSPFSLHTLAGANVFMLQLMKANSEALGVYASPEAFDQTIAATNDQLKNHSIQIETFNMERTADTLFYSLKLSNLAGHKLPSGYPSRRMSVHVVVRDELGEEIFRSGEFDPDTYAITEEDIPFEPHHQMIHTPSEVQIYEMVMGDTDGNKTTVLTRGAVHLKDNRLVPVGFTAADEVYDTTQVFGGALTDSDFNFDPMEGSGTDIIHYHVSMEGYDGPLSVEVAVYYQTLPPSWTGELFATETPEIDLFEGMVNSADHTPVLMKTLETDVNAYVGLGSTPLSSGWTATAGAGVLHLTWPSQSEIKVFDAAGRLCWKCIPGQEGSRRLSVLPGLYIVECNGDALKLVVR
ncbi:MAG: hypothetical protein JNM00_16250 [Flavobacteriales bacterium]|nr:hypothetical protein [Flavobacteriales bacterium]